MSNLFDDLNFVLDTARTNGVSLGSKFTEGYIRSHSLPDGARGLAEEILQEMRELTKFGVNNGFSRCADALADLADIVVDMTKLDEGKVSSKLGKFRDRFEKIKQKTKQQRGGTIDVTAQLRTCIMSSMEGVDTMIELRESGDALQKVDPKQFEMLERSKELLTKILGELDGVTDTTSKAAQEKADSAIESIKVWRNACSRAFLSSTSIGALQTALQRVQEWRTNLRSQVGKRELAKEEHEFEGGDDLQAIVEAKSSLELLSTFMARMAQERSEIDELMGHISEGERVKHEKLDAFQAEIDALKAQADEVGVRLDNNEITEDQANNIWNEIDRKIEDVQYRRGIFESSYENPYADLELDVQQREKMWNAFNTIVLKLESRKNDLVFLADATYGADFYSLIDCMSGVASENENGVVETISRISATIDHRIIERDIRLKTVTDIKTVQGQHQPRVATDRATIIQQDQERHGTVQQTDNGGQKINPRLAARARQQQQQQGQTGETGEGERVEPRRTISLTDEDR